MKVYKREVRDCIQAMLLGGGNDKVDMPCIKRDVEECWTCGFYLPVAQERLKRIKAHDWSWKKADNGKLIFYLKVRNDEQSYTDGTAHS